MKIEDKIVIVTGASSGIGLATARLLASRGAKVALVARSGEKLRKLAKELRDSFVIVADLRKEEEVRGMIKKTLAHYGRIDILINNAGRAYDAMIEEVETSKFRELFELNLLAPAVAMKEVIPVMRKQGGGMIVNVSSATSLMNLPGMGAYSSLKKALNGISLTGREELKKDNIVVSVIYPYMTKTDFDKNAMGVVGNMEEVVEQNKSLPPLDTAEYVAEKILEGIKSGEAEIYVHDWMKQMGQGR